MATFSDVLHNEQLWRNPDLSLDMLCERIGSIALYIGISCQKVRMLGIFSNSFVFRTPKPARHFSFGG